MNFKTFYSFLVYSSLLIHVGAGAAPKTIPGLLSSCELDTGSAIYATSKLDREALLVLLDEASSAGILGRPAANSDLLQADLNPPAPGIGPKTLPARVERTKGTIRINTESGRQWCFVDFEVPGLPALEGDKEQFSYRGRFGKTAYLRVDRFSAHDSSSSSLIEPVSGNVLDFASGRDPAMMSPDGKRFLVVKTSDPIGFAIAVPAIDGPRIDLACALPKLNYGNPLSRAAEIKGWEGNEAFALVLRPASKKSLQLPIVLRIRRESGNWQLAVSDPEAVRKAGGFRCSENIVLPAAGKSCSTGCDKVAVLTIAPALVQFPPLQKMFMLALQSGGEGHDSEINAARREVEAHCAGCDIRKHGDRKKARRLNDFGTAQLKSGRLVEAIDELQKASEADPVDVEILNNLGYAEMLAGRSEAALHLVSALIIEPGRANAWANLGHLFARKDAISEAVACFSLSLRFSAQPTKTLNFLKELAVKENKAGLTQTVQRLISQPWVEHLTKTVP